MFQFIRQIFTENMNKYIGYQISQQSCAADQHQSHKRLVEQTEKHEASDDDDQQQRKMEILNRHQESILEIIPDSVIEFGLYREDIKKYQDEGDQKDGAADEHQFAHWSTDGHTDTQIGK